MLDAALAARGLELEEVTNDVHTGRRLVDSMPAADVWVSLLTARLRNPETRWVRNHIIDADAMSVAMAYCDVVLADTESRHLLRSSGVRDRLERPMPADVIELAELL